MNVNVQPVSVRKIKGVRGNKKAREGRVRLGCRILSTNNHRKLAKVLSAIVNPANTSTDSNVEETIKMIALAD